MEDKQLSDNFWLREFKYVEPEKSLVDLLQAVRDVVSNQIIITDSTRSVQDHINIYKKIYGDDWLEKIPWGSRHLPAYEKGLRAVDFKAKKKSGYWSGAMLAEIIKIEAAKLGVYVGIGIGKQFVHLDVDRVRDTIWNYSY